MARALEYNSMMYSFQLGDKVLKETGHGSTSGKWFECGRMNGTYLDCPVSKFDD